VALVSSLLTVIFTAGSGFYIITVVGNSCKTLNKMWNLSKGISINTFG